MTESVISARSQSPAIGPPRRRPPILIEGVAATTSVELLELDTDEWIGADHLDFTDAVAASPRFRWRSTVPGVVGGELPASGPATKRED